MKHSDTISKYGNIAIEISSTAKNFESHWLEECQADILIYSDKKQKRFYAFKVDAIRRYIEQNKDRLKICTTNDGRVTNTFYCLPIHKIAYSCLIQDFDYGELEVIKS